MCAEFDLCVKCFADGVEVNNDKHHHESSHSYYVMVNSCAQHVDCNCFLQEALNFPLLCDEWTADEELSLLFAIKSNGLNNWTEVRAPQVIRASKRCAGWGVCCHQIT